MKKTTKFLFGFASTILMATGCQLAPVTPKKTAEEKVTEAQNLLVYSGLNGVTGNFELIQSVAGLEDVKITYTVSTPAVDYLAVEGTTMKVTRPKFTEGDKSFAPGFTATFTLDDVTKTKDFNVKIKALPEENKELTLVTNPVKDTNYKIAFTNATETRFFNGEMSSFYGATASHPYYGVDVQLKETTGGYHLTFVDAKGKTQYIAVAVTTNEKGTHTNFVFAETPADDGAVWTYDADNNTVITTLGGERHWIGGAGTYTTFDMYNDAEKEEKDFYPAQFYTYTGGAPVVTDKPTAATSLSTEKEYNLGMEIAEQKLVYFTGSMAQYYGASSETRSEGVVTKVETAENGYYLSFMKGSDKKYIGAEASDGHLNFKIHNEAQTVWTWDATYNTLTTTLGEEKVYIGTYGSYNTFGVSKYSTIESSYPAHFYEIGGTTDNPGTETPDTPDTPTTNPTYATEVSVEKSYNLGMVIANDKLVYFTGTIPEGTYYGATSQNRSEAVVVKVEATEGGYYLSFTIDSVKKYIGAEASGTHLNFKIHNEARTVWAWDAQYNTLTTTLGEKTVFMGTYSTFSTFGVSDYSKIATSYPAHFYEIGGTTETPDNPGTDTPVEPETPAVVTATIAEALTVGRALNGNSMEKTTTVYSVTGTVKISNGKYYLTDGTNEIQIYGNDYTGVNSGYTLTVEGKIQNFYGTIEIVEFVIKSSIAVNYTITLPTDQNGTVTASATSDIAWGTEVTITVSANQGYKVEWVKANGVTQELDSNNQFKFKVTSDTVITVSFVDENAQEIVLTKASMTISNDIISVNEGVSKSYTQNGITLTNYKAGNSTWNTEAVPTRCYQGTKLEVSYTSEIRKIVLVTDGDKKLNSSDVIDGATLTVEGKNVILELEEPTTKFTITQLPKQIRVASVEVYYVAA